MELADKVHVLYCMCHPLLLPPSAATSRSLVPWETRLPPLSYWRPSSLVWANFASGGERRSVADQLGGGGHGGDLLFCR